MITGDWPGFKQITKEREFMDLDDMPRGFLLCRTTEGWEAAIIHGKPVAELGEASFFLPEDAVIAEGSTPAEAVANLRARLGDLRSRNKA